jgi:hypothetical protein
VTRQDLLDWLAARQPARPAALAERMDRAVAESPDAVLAAAPSPATALGNIGLLMLTDLTQREPQADGLALDLLAADAFVTYAFEAAAEQGEPIAPLARGMVAEASR